MSYIPMSQRLKEPNTSPIHVYNIAKRAYERVEEKPISLSLELDQYSINRLSDNSKFKYADWLLANYSPGTIDNINAELVREYKRNGGRAFKKGRSPGALNKDKGISRDEYNALSDLPSPNNEEKQEAPANVDLSNYVTKPELQDFKVDVASAVTDIRHDISAITTKVANIVDNRPTIIELKRPELPNIEMGVQHKNFPLFVKAAQARLRSNSHVNIWLHGPAGTGKTTAAEKLAELMGRDFYYNGALTSAFQLTGYNDANGKYVTTAFRRAWENGGVYLFDEIDGSMPDALLAMNGALANGIASFPDGMIPRHKDCIIIAGANTTGMGGGIEYVGAMKQNAAFLNRFVYIAWPHDNALEDALCANKEWIERVRYVRARFATQGNKGHLITMRATIFGEALLAAGLSQEEVEEATLKQGLSDAQWNAIK